MTIRERLEEVKAKEYLTVEDVALLLSCHPNTVYRNKDLAGRTYVGRVLRFHRVTLMRGLRDQQKPEEGTRIVSSLTPAPACV